MLIIFLIYTKLKSFWQRDVDYVTFRLYEKYEKLFSFGNFRGPTNLKSAHKMLTSHRTKTNEQLQFYPRQPTVSLHYNNPFSKNNSFASAVLLPFRTDSKPFRRRFVGKTGFDMNRRKTLQNHFRQSFESSPESRGSQTSGVLFGSFCTTQKE